MAWLGLAGVSLSERWALLILLGGTGTVMYSIWTGIEYWLEDNRLFLRVSFFHVKIPLNAIKRIERSNYPVLGIRMGLAFTGLRIWWGSRFSLFISPEEEERFLQEIKETQPDIIINL